VPKLLLFAPCQRVLFDQHQNISLIEILEQIEVPVPENMPKGAQAPINWEILVVWSKVPEDEGRTFEQDIMLMAPDGTMASHIKTQFAMATRMHRNIATIYGFPIAQAGEYSLDLKLKDMQNETVFTLETSFPLFLIHQAKPGTSTP
jgi:hypothetical protein